MLFFTLSILSCQQKCPQLSSRPIFIIFIFLFFNFTVKISVSWNTVISFRSKKAWIFFRLFFIFLCDVLDKLWKILQRRIEQSREGSLSAQHYCKYLGPQLSHSFTTVETCQATKNCKTNVIYQHFGDRFTQKKRKFC